MNHIGLEVYACDGRKENGSDLGIGDVTLSGPHEVKECDDQRKVSDEPDIS